MYLSAFPHRDDLYHITNRWLSDALEPEHPLVITRIVSYDSFAAWETLLRFISALHDSVVHDTVERKKINLKKDLKDSICHTGIQPTERTRTLISAYMKMPELYYIRSPITGYIYYDSRHRIISLCRFKRIRRIAEKMSRYASRYLFGEEPHPDGIFQQPVAPEYRLESEKQLMSRLKTTGIQLPVEAVSIKDVLGMKLIDYGNGQILLESFLSFYPGTRIMEKEYHTGSYNAVHYLVDLKLDPDYLIRRFLTNTHRNEFARRGLPEEHLNEDFARFIVTGSNSVQLDLILTSFEELVESEIGRSMHETRIYRQRCRQRLYGNIPMNIEYIIEFMLTVGLSPTLVIDEIPIKLWGRNLEDTLYYNIRKLYNIPEYCLIEP